MSPHSVSTKRSEVAVVTLAVIGAAVASHLAAYQLGWISSAWDPVFGSRSSALVLHSRFSEALPVSDAAVGAVAYVIEAVLATVLALHASRRANALYAVLLIGTGAVAVVLSALQLFVVHHLCLLCLGSAALSTTIAVLALPTAIRRARAPDPAAR
jgi:uncharacterized membrane protein